MRFGRWLVAAALACAVLGAGCTAVGYLSGEAFDRRMVASPVDGQRWRLLAPGTRVGLELTDRTSMRGRLVACLPPSADVGARVDSLLLSIPAPNRASSVTVNLAPPTERVIACADVRAARKYELNTKHQATFALTATGWLMDMASIAAALSAGRISGN